MSSNKSHFLELKEYCNKTIILDYQIEEITYEFFNKKIKTNKWIDFPVWLKIHEKLEQILKQDSTKNKENNLNDFCRDEFFVLNNSVSVVIVKDSLERKFTKIFNISIDEIQPFIIRIHINVVEENNNIFNKESIKNEIKNNLATKIPECNEYNPLSPRATKSKSNSDLVIRNENDFIPYKPSIKDVQTSIIQTENINLENDPYSPKPTDIDSQLSIEDDPDLFVDTSNNNIPKYKASPILNKLKELNKSKSPETVEVRRKSQRSPQKRIAFDDIEPVRETRSRTRTNYLPMKQSKEEKKIQLFGSDDSDIEVRSSNQPKRDNYKIKKSKKIETSNTKGKLNFSTEESDDNIHEKKYKKSKIDRHADCQQQNKLDNWLNTSNITSRNKHHNNKFRKKVVVKLSPDHTSSSSSPKTTLPERVNNTPGRLNNLTDEERRLRRQQLQKEINALNEYNKQIKQRIKPTPNTEYKSLNHIPIIEILNTFTKYKSLLDKHFNSYKSKKNHHVKPIEGLDHFALINIVNDDYQLDMLNCLKAAYEIPDDVPCYTDLFMTLILPEWILALFIDIYKLTRENAIQHLKNQEETKLCSLMNNSMLNFSALEKM